MIEHVDQFICEILKSAVPAGKQRFYRGVRKHYPTTQPSVFRSDLRKKKEKWLFDQLLAAHPSDFGTDGTTLDKLVRMQHHGLPTRLLDITSNPLMALFFACSSDPCPCGRPGDTGEVLSFVVSDDDVKFPDSDRASVIANLARLTWEQRESIAARLRTRTSPTELRKLDAIRKLVHFIRQEKPYFESRIVPQHLSTIIVVRPKKSNPRIAAQSGAFLLFGDNADFETARKGQGSVTQTLEVTPLAKVAILRELDQLGINASTVYPSLESSAAYIAAPFARID